MTSDKIKDVLQKLGYKLTDFGTHWRTNALYRGGNNTTALQIYKDSGVWVDYVQQGAYLPLKSLVEATLQTNDERTIKEILGGYDFDSPSVPDEKPSNKIEVEKTYPDSILNRLLPHYKFYNDKGISSKTLSFFKAGLATEGGMYQRFVFPIYNKHGQIHGFSGRDMIKNNPKRPKWKHMGKKSSWIYPFYVPAENETHPVQDAVFSTQELILVESIGDLLSLHERGIKNVIPVFGTSISSALTCFLMPLGLKKIIISLNNDYNKEKNRGEIGALKIYLKLLNYFDKDKLFIHLPTQNDFGDMGSEDFSKWLETLGDISLPEKQEEWHNKILNLVKSNDISKSLYKKKYFK